MPGPDRHDTGQDRRAGKVKIADAVQNFVADELVVEPEAIPVHDAIAVDADGIVGWAIFRFFPSP